ncbi:MAG: HisA/HisF-related TIM barrel protein [Bacilli bacterium]
MWLKKLAAAEENFIFTDIDTDGMLSGVNLVSQKMLDILCLFTLLIASGVASPKDIEDLNLLFANIATWMGL